MLGVFMHFMIDVKSDIAELVNRKLDLIIWNHLGEDNLISTCAFVFCYHVQNVAPSSHYHPWYVISVVRKVGSAISV